MELNEILDRMNQLQELTTWADSPEGKELRAELAAQNCEFPPTAEDVLALLDPELAAECRTNLGMEN